MSDPMPDPTRRRTTRLVDRVGWLLVGVGVLVLFAKLGGISSARYGWASWKPWTWRPGPLFRNTTATGGDMGAHVWTPDFLRKHVLSTFNATGWSKDWFAGFPVLHFYFPLPSWVIVAMGTVIPPNVAFKLVSVFGLLSLPFAGMFLARSAHVARHFRYLFAIAALVFVLDPGYSILGGNALSTLAGEFSFSISLSACVVYLALLIRVLRAGRGRLFAVAALTVTGLSHLLPTLFAGMSTLIVVGVHMTVRGSTSVQRRLLDTAMIGTLAAMLAAFWVVPFGTQLSFTNDMEWERATAYLGALFPPAADKPASGAAIMGVVVFLALGGGLVQLARFVSALRSHEEPDAEARLATCLVLMAVGAALAFRFPPSFRILNERALPFYFLSCCLLAAFGFSAVGRLILGGIRRVSTVGERSGFSELRNAPVVGLVSVAALCWWSVGGVMGILPGAVPVLQFDARGLGLQRADQVGDRNPIADWAKENFDGYEATDEWPELRALITTMKKVGRTNGCGRATWDYEDEFARYGTEFAPALLPMWTDGCIGSMEGLFLESSPSLPYLLINASMLSARPGNPQGRLPYPGLNVAEGVRRLQQWGVRYYLVFSPAAQQEAQVNPDLRLLATTPYTRDCEPEELSAKECPTTWEVYEVANSALVEGLAVQPAVLTGITQAQRGGWLDVAMAQYMDPSKFPVPFAANGPTSWQRVAASVDRPFASNFGEGTTVAVATQQTLGSVSVSDIDEKNGSISFTVDRIGVPVVVKESYFPTWRATGADGPFRLAPNMMVVIPRETEVTLRVERDAAGIAGLLLSALGVLGVSAHVVHSRRRIRRDQRTWSNGPTPSRSTVKVLPEDAGSKG